MIVQKPLILAIESALKTCSVALTEGSELLAMEEGEGNNIHSERITIYIQEVLKQAHRDAKDIGLICISKGPGSYTGLRIGVSVAKGLAFGLNVPLVSVSTLEALTVNALLHQKDQDIWYCPMIDARRMEVYTCLYDADLDLKKEITAKIIDELSFAEELDSKKICFYGDGMPKCREVLEKHPNARFIEGIRTSAAFLIPTALAKFEKGDLENLLTFEPYYLKEFYTLAKPQNFQH